MDGAGGGGFQVFYSLSGEPGVQKFSDRGVAVGGGGVIKLDAESVIRLQSSNQNSSAIGVAADKVE